MTDLNFTKKQKIYAGLALLFLIIIFISSSMTYRQQRITQDLGSGRFLWVKQMISNWQIRYNGEIHSTANDGSASFLEFLIRKCAHFGFYALIGIFSLLGLQPMFKSPKAAPVFIWLSVTGLAAFDEFHQLLTGDRTPNISDVVLDSMGCLLGIVLVVICRYIWRKHQEKRVSR